MALPDEAKAMGTPAMWVSYVFVDDVEHLVRRLPCLSRLHRPRSMMTFHRRVSSRSCFFQSGSQAASCAQNRSE